MFIVSLSYTSELTEVDKHIKAHIGFLEKYYADGFFIASGRKVPRTGGIILVQASNKTEVENIIKRDPFYQANVAKYEITEFVPTMTSPQFEALKKSV